MRRTFALLDDALIEHVFQPISDAIMQRFGLDRLRVAALCLDAASLAWIVSRAGPLGDAVRDWNGGGACLSVLLLVVGLVAMSSLRSLFRRIGASRGANPLRPAMQAHRGVVFALVAARLMSAGDLTAVTELLMLGFAMVALYLGACAPRPPVRRRTLSWMESGI